MEFLWESPGKLYKSWLDRYNQYLLTWEVPEEPIKPLNPRVDQIPEYLFHHMGPDYIPSMIEAKKQALEEVERKRLYALSIAIPDQLEFDADF